MRIIVLLLVGILMLGCVSEVETSKPNVSEQSNESTITNVTTSNGPEAPPVNKTVVVNDNQTVNNATNITTNASTLNVMTTDTVFPEEPIFDFNLTDEQGGWIVYFFHSPACSACQDTYPIIEELEDEYPGVTFINYSLATQNGSKAYVQFAKLYNLSTQKQMVPQVLVNGTILTDRFNIDGQLGPLLENLTEETP